VRLVADEFCAREGIPVPAFSREALDLLLHHDYPGNVRELQNVIEAAVSLGDRRVDAKLVRSLLGTAGDGGPAPLDLQTVERRHIQRVLGLCAGNKSAAARLLGMDRRTLQRKGF